MANFNNLKSLIAEQIKKKKEAKKRTPVEVNNEVINEISKKLAAKYINKAADPHDEQGIATQAQRAGYKLGSADGFEGDIGNKEERKTYYRSKGIQRALKRLTNEDLENLDEISTKKLDKYINRAIEDHGHSHFASNQTQNSNEKQYFDNRTKKRKMGISTAYKILDKKQVNENFQIGDNVHLGFGSKGGAGFRGKLIKAKNGKVWVRQHEADAKHKKYGPKVWIGSEKKLTKEEAINEVLGVYTPDPIKGTLDRQTNQVGKKVKINNRNDDQYNGATGVVTFSNNKGMHHAVKLSGREKEVWFLGKHLVSVDDK